MCVCTAARVSAFFVFLFLLFCVFTIPAFSISSVSLIFYFIPFLALTLPYLQRTNLYENFSLFIVSISTFFCNIFSHFFISNYYHILIFCQILKLKLRIAIALYYSSQLFLIYFFYIIIFKSFKYYYKFLQIFFLFHPLILQISS